LVELRDVAKVYGDVTVLHDIDLSLRDGEFMTVVGPSGSGKTTILRMIGGLTAPSRGAVLLDGDDITGLPINRRPFNTVFQDYALFPHMTVAANVGYGLMVRGVAKAEIGKRVAEALDLVALGDFSARYPGQLSGGQRQRVALSRAIICEPRLILLDEPLGALDAELRRQMQRFLKRLQREIKTSFLFVTHDQEEAVTVADRICVMSQGRIVQIGSPREVYFRPRTEYVARFFGDNNLIEGTVAAGDGDRTRVDTALGSFAVALDDGRAAPPVGHPVKLVVRPEAIHLGGLAPDIGNRLRVRIEDIGFVGPISQIQVRSVARPEIDLMVKLSSRAGGLPLAEGGETEIGWSDDECHLVAP